MERQPVRFLGRELAGLLDEARSGSGRSSAPDPDGLAFVPNATTGVSTVLALAALRAGRRAADHDHEYNATLNALRAVAEPDGATVVVARIPFPIDDDRTPSTPSSDAVTPRTRLALVSQVTSPTALVLPIARARRGELDGGHRHARRRRPRAGHDRRSTSMPWARPTARATATSGCARRRAPAFLYVRADRGTRIRPLVVSHGANAPRTGPRFRLEFDWTVPPTRRRTWRCRPRSTVGRARRRVAGRRSWP